MKIFQNKLPKIWKSTGIKFINGQMEMSSFSFAEEFFKSTSNKFTINMIGKNIIGNGVFSIKIYKDQFLVWQEELSFKGTSFSKRTVEIEEEPDKEFKIVLSRGRESKGKILINSVMIAQEVLVLKISEPQVEVQPEQRYEPTFISTIEDDGPQEIILLDEKTEKIEKKTSSRKKPSQKKKEPKKEVVPTNKKSQVKKEFIASDSNDNLGINTSQSNTGAEQLVVSEEIPILETSKEKIKNNIWVHVIDFSTIEDERDVFKYLNQISFGRGKQIFLIKKNDDLEVDLSKYDYVNVLNENSDIKEKLIELNPEKITFLQKNLNEELFSLVKKLKDE
jgi:hypothetical protein